MRPHKLSGSFCSYSIPWIWYGWSDSWIFGVTDKMVSQKSSWCVCVCVCVCVCGEVCIIIQVYYLFLSQFWQVMLFSRKLSIFHTYRFINTELLIVFFIFYQACICKYTSPFFLTSNIVCYFFSPFGSWEVSPKICLFLLAFQRISY